MKDPRQLVIQINQEEKELNEKLTRLEYFMMTEDYQRISERQKLLLKDQHEAMDRYKRILIARAIQINFEEKDKEEPAEEKDCRDCANSLDGGKHCTGDKEHGWVDTTGKKRCFEPKEPDFPQCPYNNTGRFIVCRHREKNQCTAPDTHCYKSAAGKKEEDGTPSDK